MMEDPGERAGGHLQAKERPWREPALRHQALRLPPSAVRHDFSVGSGPVVVLHCGAPADCCREEGRLFNRRLSTGQLQLRMETRPPYPEIAAPSAQGCFVASVA